MEINPKYGNQGEEMNEIEFIQLFLNDDEIEINPENKK